MIDPQTGELYWRMASSTGDAVYSVTEESAKKNKIILYSVYKSQLYLSSIAFLLAALFFPYFLDKAFLYARTFLGLKIGGEQFGLPLLYSILWFAFVFGSTVKLIESLYFVLHKKNQASTEESFILAMKDLEAAQTADTAAQIKQHEQKPEAAEAAAPDNLAEKAGLLGAGGILIGQTEKGQPLRYDGERHLVTFGNTRAGKFTTVQAPVLFSLDRPMLVIDPKGQAAAVTERARREMGHKVFIVNPFGLHGLPRHRFNPLAALDPDSDSFDSDVSLLVNGIVDSSGDDKFWSASARNLFTWLIMYTVIYEGEKTLSTVRDLLSLPPALFEDLARKAAQSDFPALRNPAASFTSLDKTLLGVIETCKTDTKIFDEKRIRESLSASDFEFSDLKNGKVTIYLILPGKMLLSHAKWLRVMVQSALSAMYQSHDGERVLFLLDEFANLGYMPDIAAAMSLGAGYGIQLWPFFQDFNQLESRYEQAAETFLGNAGITQTFTAADMTTARYFSERSGVKPHWHKNLNLGGGGSMGEGEKPLFSPYDLLGLPADEQLIIKDGIDQGIPAKKTIAYHKPESPFCKMADIDPTLIKPKKAA